MPDGCCATLLCHIRLFRRREGGTHLCLVSLSTTLYAPMSASVFTSKPYMTQLCGDSLLVHLA